MCYVFGMAKQPKRPRGRPSLEGEPMQQIAIRLPEGMLKNIDRIVKDGRGAYGRTHVIRKLLWNAIIRFEKDGQL